MYPKIANQIKINVYDPYNIFVLIVPEINGTELEQSDMIIANPNCSTIQLVMALAPLHRKYKIQRQIL